MKKYRNTYKQNKFFSRQREGEKCQKNVFIAEVE